MVDFIKENTSNAVKLFVNQIAMTIFGLLLSAAAFRNNTINIAVGVLSILLYYYLLYTAAWDIGARDKIKVDGGRMKYEPHKGVYISLLANSVNIILAAVIIAFYYIGTLANLDFAKSVFAIAFMIMRFLNGMFVSVLSLVKAEPANIFLQAATIIPTVAVSALAYLAGLKNFRIFGAKKR